VFVLMLLIVVAVMVFTRLPEPIRERAVWVSLVIFVLIPCIVIGLSLHHLREMWKKWTTKKNVGD
jgi:hypothetical protein